MTDEIHDAQPQDATMDPRVPSVILQLGVEARAEYIRARQWLGLTDGPAERLGTVGRYRLEAELGRGGMGIVFRASDPELDRPVAIKLVQAVPFARYDKLRTRLLREAKVLAKLTHPNVVRIYDCGQHEGEVYLAMELVEGTTLREWQRERSERGILDAYQQAARGLAAAHELGITHRDFKPDNVLVASDGRVLVGDFGLAGVPAGDELRSEGTIVDGSPGEHVSATRSGALLGTPAYMAPEQLRGEGATALSDQFAFCVSLWEALTGERPFAGEKREELLGEIENGRVRGAERLPRRLRRLLLRGLALEPAARFERLQELAEAMGPRRGRGVAALSVSLAVALGVVAWLSMREPPCDLPAKLDEVAAMEHWRRVDERPELGPLYEDLRNITWSMRAEAEALCQPSNDDQVVRRAWLGSWIDYLRLTLEEEPGKDDLDLLQETIRFIQNERQNGPPPRRLADEVNALLRASYAAQLINDLENALSTATSALDVPSAQSTERAIIHQRRGRILALKGDHREAMAAYREAMSYAEPASYPHARLMTALLAAKTAAMRLGDFERAQDFLAVARGLLTFLREPLLSPRRADYHEIMATILKHDEEYDAALLHQGYALLVYGGWGDTIDIGRAFNNIGTIFELRNSGPNVALARVCYERALQTLDDRRYSPEWFQAAFNFGHWIVVYGKEDEWPRAEELLEQVLDASQDAAPSALTDLVLLEINRVDGQEALNRARELEAILSEDAGPNTPSLSAVRRLNAWKTIVNAHSLAADLTGFETARANLERVAQEVVASGSLSASVVEQDMVASDLTAAYALSDSAPERALELATSARKYFLSLPEAKRDTEMERQLGYAERLIAELRPSTPPAPPPPSDGP